MVLLANHQHVNLGMAYVTKLNFRGITAENLQNLGFSMFQFSPFIQIILFHNNTAAT